MKNHFLGLLLLSTCGLNLFSQTVPCFGEKSELKLSQTTSYIKVKVGLTEGYYLIDYGTTRSTIDTNNFINGKPKLSNGTTNKFDNFDFFGSWGTVVLDVQDHSNINGLAGFKQAGILGTDFLALNIFTLDLENSLLYRAGVNSFCSDKVLKALGFKASSTRGYFSNDYNNLNNCATNIPTVPIKIGKISAIAQIDPGYNDFRFKHSLNINQALYDALLEANIKLIENPAANLLLSTCVNNLVEPVKAYKLPVGTSFSITSVDGNPILLTSDINIFLKQTPSQAISCGGIGAWKIPAAQIGASFLIDNKKVIFDPFKSKVWFLRK